MKLIERKKEAANVESFIFEPQEPLQWQAGQFLHWVLHHEPTDERGSDRWFTVSAAPFEGHVMLTTRFIEDGIEGQQSSFKKALKALAVGSEAMEVSDVDGDFIVEDPTKPIVLIAGGIGITPYRAILKELDSAGAKINAALIYANRDGDFAFKAELDELARGQGGFVVAYLAGERLDEAKLKELVPDFAVPTFYVSGPEPMVESLQALLKTLGVAPERFKGDWFPGYPSEFVK